MNATLCRAIFLDFDGVLFDTVREAYAVSMIALGRSARIVDVNFDSAHFEKFSRYRYLIGPAWNYYYLIRAIDEETLASGNEVESEFRKSLGQWKEGEHRSFEENFFQTRNRLRESDRNGWLSLIVPYGMVDDVRTLLQNHPEKFFMVTTRDRESVIHLLRLHRLEIPEDNIFAKEEYAVCNSKMEIIRSLISDRQIEKSMFIDDLEDHLAACKVVENLLPLQAMWGYVAPDKKEDNSVNILKEIEKFIHGKNVWA